MAFHWPRTLLLALSGLAAEKKLREFRETLNHGIDHLVFANLPASIFLCVLCFPIMRLLFEQWRVGPTDSLQAGRALLFLAPGLVAFSLVNIFARAFYALGDTKTPMKVSIACLVLNLVLSIALVLPMRQRGLGLANTLSALCNLTLLFICLRQKMGGLELPGLKQNIFRLLMAATVAGLVVWGTKSAWESHIGHDGLVRRLGDVFVPLILGSGIYFGMALALRVPAAHEMSDLVRHRLQKPHG